MDTTKKTIILFSGDFDKVMAALIIANGAAAMGDEVTIFCTFWGLNILRKTEKVVTKDKKTTLQSMFGMMMPKGTKRLGLSKMNFAGAGSPMMRAAMTLSNSPLNRMIVFLLVSTSCLLSRGPQDPSRGTVWYWK